MQNYDDCVLKNKNKKTGHVSCWGLTTMLCTEGVKCPFYGSNKEYYRDEKGFIRRKDGVKK